MPETPVDVERMAATGQAVGHVARVGPNTLVTDDPEVVKRMWAVRSRYKKGDFYDAVRFDPTRDNIISTRDDERHNELRAKMAAGYAGKENEGLELGIDKGIMAFIHLIERDYVSEGAIYRPMDLARKAQYLTLDIIGDIAFGSNFGHLTQDADVHEYIKRTEASMPAMMIVSVLPVLARLMQSPLLRRFMPSENDPHGFGKFIGVAKRVVAERLGPNGADRKDMLGSFLKHGLSREEAEGEALVNIIAGSDTTATAIRTTMLYLMSSPQAYRKLAHEIRTAAAKGQISSPITDEEARTLPYLQAVIKEGLRVFPPVTGLMPTVVPPGGDVIRGIPVPEGTEVGWSAFGVQHNKGVYGLDAETFRPERWLEVKDDLLLQQMTSTWELVFKYGKWQCLGRSVALLELNKIFVELLRRYDFGLLNPPSPWNSFSAGIFIQSELWVKVTRI
ncbi:putative benzoate 4-monooxygenase cytochrome p450 [Diaporthe ampelina]|uniref:Putative benzoate 4-monooxygenase cytochrome p450 n=1 Tax=Diaporthe ampelina TaxID=1214573 RepID=A0A0G2HM39_9PEZI|nr:putative benzoate 4-monooxygenase cytochrome p450 [Diaporthe ampelina]